MYLVCGRPVIDPPIGLTRARPCPVGARPYRGRRHRLRPRSSRAVSVDVAGSSVTAGVLRPAQPRQAPWAARAGAIGRGAHCVDLEARDPGGLKAYASAANEGRPINYASGLVGAWHDGRRVAGRPPTPPGRVHCPHSRSGLATRPADLGRFEALRPAGGGRLLRRRGSPACSLLRPRPARRLLRVPPGLASVGGVPTFHSRASTSSRWCPATLADGAEEICPRAAATAAHLTTATSHTSHRTSTACLAWCPGPQAAGCRGSRPWSYPYCSGIERGIGRRSGHPERLGERGLSAILGLPNSPTGERVAGAAAARAARRPTRAGW